MRENKNAHKRLDGKSERKRPLWWLT